MSEDYAQERLPGMERIGEDHFTLEEIARGFRETDSLQPEYDMQKLCKAILQAKKNRLWDAQEGQ